MQDDSQVNKILDLLNGDAGIDNTLSLSASAKRSTPKKISPEQKKLEEKFKAENFDLINWFVISNK